MSPEDSASCLPVPRLSASRVRLSGSQDGARDEKEECGERGREVKRLQVEAEMHWPMAFWVMGGDKTGGTEE